LSRLVVTLRTTAGSQLTVATYSGGNSTTLYMGNMVNVQFVAGTWYTIRLEMSIDNGFVPARPHLRVYVDNVLQYEATINHPGVGGRIRFSRTGTGVIKFDNVRIWRVPMRYAVIGPTSEEVSSTF
jgi:hypothetical protein